MGGFRTAALGLAAAFLLAPLANAASWMTLTSTSIKDGARIAVRFGGDDQKRACSPRTPTLICPCPGKNVSPELAWHNLPEGTKSLAILMYDVDGQFGAGVSHWVAYNILPTTTELKEGDGTAGTGFLQNDACWRELERLPRGDLRSPFYIRVEVADQPGVLAHIAQRLAEHEVSIARLVQHQRDGGATLHVVTHEGRAGAVDAALEEIAALPETQSAPTALPVISSRGVTGTGWT